VIGNFIKFIAFRLNRDQVRDLKTWFKINPAKKKKKKDEPKKTPNKKKKKKKESNQKTTTTKKKENTIFKIVL